MDWIKNPIVLRLAAVFAGIAAMALRQYATTHAFDLYALAGRIADELDAIAVGGLIGWLLVKRPGDLPPSDEEPPA